MTEEIDTIAFDAGGTLFEMDPPRAQTFSEVLAEDGFKVDIDVLTEAMRSAERSLDGEFAKIVGGDDHAFWVMYDHEVLDDVGYQGDYAAISRKISEAFSKRIPDVNRWKDFPETKRVLMGLRRRGFKLGVISNASDLVNRVLDHLDLTRHFDFIVVSETVGVCKPSQEIFRMAAARAHTPPNRMLYVGDRLATDVVGAVNAGMNAMLVDRWDSYPDAECFRIRDLNWFERFL